ncbi:hypothetical protein ACELLULO517_26845 [Acidisoma cellulosilytica]|uniref:Uncharacterized protein n=1 Tax=Acidisoma cellulosilyticum TaxID=2802395 RepID=A0A964E7D8_9PROT|nr:hypothetical protein [Acidisoma cellulosilyticum]MCB8883893.1 hypothetical protein [Acidisoma cellulosilyticum]
MFKRLFHRFLQQNYSFQKLSEFCQRREKAEISKPHSLAGHIFVFSLSASKPMSASDGLNVCLASRMFEKVDGADPKGLCGNMTLPELLLTDPIQKFIPDGGDLIHCACLGWDGMHCRKAIGRSSFAR